MTGQLIKSFTIYTFLQASEIEAKIKSLWYTPSKTTTYFSFLTSPHGFFNTAIFDSGARKLVWVGHPLFRHKVNTKKNIPTDWPTDNKETDIRFHRDAVAEHVLILFCGLNKHYLFILTLLYIKQNCGNPLHEMYICIYEVNWNFNKYSIAYFYPLMICIRCYIMY